MAAIRPIFVRPHSLSIGFWGVLFPFILPNFMIICEGVKTVLCSQRKNMKIVKLRLWWPSWICKQIYWLIFNSSHYVTIWTKFRANRTYGSRDTFFPEKNKDGRQSAILNPATPIFDRVRETYPYNIILKFCDDTSNLFWVIAFTRKSSHKTAGDIACFLQKSFTC